MPNWCDNRLTVYGEENALEDFKDDAYGVGLPSAVEVSALDFEKLLPVPKDTAVQFAEAKGSALFKVFDAMGTIRDDEGALYWRLANWGTKWDADHVVLSYNFHLRSNAKLTYEFDTANSPPVALFDNICPTYQELRFVLEYVELGCDFAGYYEWKDGVRTIEDEGRPAEFEFSRKFAEEISEMTSDS